LVRIQGDDQSDGSTTPKEDKALMIAKDGRRKYRPPSAGSHPGDDHILNTVLPLFRKIKSKLEPYALTIYRVIVIHIEQLLMIITIRQPQ